MLVEVLQGGRIDRVVPVVVEISPSSAPVGPDQLGKVRPTGKLEAATNSLETQADKNLGMPRKPTGLDLTRLTNRGFT